MTDAPERIWLAHNGGLPSGNYPQEMKKGYVREDLHTALQARLAEVEADKRWIMEERDRTFALMLSRAEAAEARVKVLEDALQWAYSGDGLDQCAFAFQRVTNPLRRPDGSDHAVQVGIRRVIDMIRKRAALATMEGQG
jgi:hypothetical protein